MFSSFLNGSLHALYIQPRMGFKNIADMRKAIIRVKECGLNTIGTLTLDSYSRQYDLKKIKLAFSRNKDLNGFPLIYYPPEEIKKEIVSLQNKNFPLQVRHGMPEPFMMVQKMLQCGLNYTEGGPISYCLPYSRKPLSVSFESWKKTTALLASCDGHIESFGGCMLGQLCPPSMLIVINILEGLFFKKYGLQDMSFTYGQGYNIDQDIAAMRVLKHLIEKYVDPKVYHTAVYTFMGNYPVTHTGHMNILKDSVKLALASGSKRLIYKTAVESERLPTLDENIMALKASQGFSNQFVNYKPIFDQIEYESILKEAEKIIQVILKLDPDLETSILKAFEIGYLDIPYCLHPNNCSKSSVVLSEVGYLKWGSVGNIPIDSSVHKNTVLSSEQFLSMLYYNRIKYDSCENNSM